MADIDELADAMERMAFDRLSTAAPVQDSTPMEYANLTDAEADQFRSAIDCVRSVMSLEGPPRAADPSSSPVAYIRKFLSRSVRPPLREFVEIGAVPLFLDVATRALSQTPPFQDGACGHFGKASEAAHDALWALNNVASGPSSMTQAVVDAGCVPLFVHVAQTHTSPQLATISAWALGNIAGDSVPLRDFVIAHGSVAAICGAIGRHAGSNLDLLRNCAWALSNMVRYKPHPTRDVIEPVIVMAHSLLINTHDDEVASDALWCFAYSLDSDCCDLVARYACDNGLLPGVVTSLLSANKILATAALRIVGGVATQGDELTESVVQLGAVEVLARSMSDGTIGRREKDALWFMSNIAAGNKAQVERVLQRYDDGRTEAPLEYAARRLREGRDRIDFPTAKEAMWVVANVATSVDAATMLCLLEQLFLVEATATFLQGFMHEGPKAIDVALECFGAMFANHPEWCANKMDELGLTGLLAQVEGTVNLNEQELERLHRVAMLLPNNEFVGSPEDES